MEERLHRLREEGNRHFAAKEFKEAVSKYSEAIRCWYGCIHEEPPPQPQPLQPGFKSLLMIAAQTLTSSCTGGPSSAHTSMVDIAIDRSQLEEQLKPHALFSNRSAALLHLSKYDAALDDALAAIRIRPRWSKGHFRKAEALLMLRQYEEAIAAFYRAMELQDTQDSTELIEHRILYAKFLLDDNNMNMRIIQLLAGRDFAVSSRSPISALIFNFARMLQNYIYIIACETTKECMIVDACWDVDSVLGKISELGYTLTGAIVTHYHFDHVGGKPPKPYDQYKIKVDGLAKVLRKFPTIKAYIHSEDIPGVLEGNEIPVERIEPTHDDYVLKIGQSVSIRFIHTPGHTPGSQCLLVNDRRLFSGDTLFIGNIGRLDFPDSNVARMFDSLKKLKLLSDDIMVYAGHDYGGQFTTVGKERKTNPVLRASTLDEFTLVASHT